MSTLLDVAIIGAGSAGLAAVANWIAACDRIMPHPGPASH